MKSLFVQGPLSPSALVRSLPLLLIIAGVLALAYIFLRQLGYDSTTIEVIDMKTSEVQTFRIVTVLPRDAIAAITDPSFVTAERAIGWMDDREAGSRVPGSGVRGRGSGERETTASSLAGKEESSRKEDNSGQGKDGPAGAIAQGGNGR